MKSPTSIYHGILELLYFILILFYFYLFFLIWFYLFFWVNEEACDHGHMICHMIQHHRSKHCSRTIMSESMTTICSSCGNSMVVRVVNVGLHFIFFFSIFFSFFIYFSFTLLWD